MKIIAVILIVITSMVAAEEVSPEFKKFGDAITYYYQDKNAEKLKEIDEGVTKNIAQLGKTNFGEMTTIGLALAAKELKYELVGKTKIHDNARLLMTDKWNSLQKYLDDCTDVGPDKLDIWWTAYFMTGNSKYLQNIIDVAIAEQKEGQLNLAISAAKWSFKANCKQHDSVLKFAQRINIILRNTYITECINWGIGGK